MVGRVARTGLVGIVGTGTGLVGIIAGTGLTCTVAVAITPGAVALLMLIHRGSSSLSTTSMRTGVGLQRKKDLTMACLVSCFFLLGWSQ